MNERDIITEAIRLIRDVGWCQGYDARDANGSRCSIFSGHAAAFCLNGAIQAAAIAHMPKGLPTLKYAPALNMSEGVRGRVQRFFERMHVTAMSFWTWNDHPCRTKAEVLALLEAYLLTLTTPAHLAGAGGANENQSVSTPQDVQQDVAKVEGGLEPALQ